MSSAQTCRFGCCRRRRHVPLRMSCVPHFVRASCLVGLGDDRGPHVACCKFFQSPWARLSSWVFRHISCMMCLSQQVRAALRFKEASCVVPFELPSSPSRLVARIALSLFLQTLSGLPSSWRGGGGGDSASRRCFGRPRGTQTPAAGENAALFASLAPTSSAVSTRAGEELPLCGVFGLATQFLWQGKRERQHRAASDGRSAAGFAPRWHPHARPRIGRGVRMARRQ